MAGTLAQLPNHSSEQSYMASIELRTGDAEMNDTLCILKDVTVSIVLPEEMILAVSSLSSHPTSRHLIHQYNYCFSGYLLESECLRSNAEKMGIIWTVCTLTQRIC